jgi:hypothetical protein
VAVDLLQRAHDPVKRGHFHERDLHMSTTISYSPRSTVASSWSPSIGIEHASKLCGLRRRRAIAPASDEKQQRRRALS